MYKSLFLLPLMFPRKHAFFWKDINNILGNLYSKVFKPQITFSSLYFCVCLQQQLEFF